MGNLFEFHFRMQIFNGFLCRPFHFVSFVKRKLSHTNMQANCLGLGARSWELVAFALTFMAEKAVHKNPAHQAHPPTGSLLGSSLRLGLRNNWNKFAISAQTFCWPSAHKHKHAQREKYLFSGKSRVSGNTNFPGTKLNKYYTWVAYRINRAFSSNINILLATRMFLSVYRAQALWCRQTSTERYKNAAANCAAVKDAE